jgi:hypothetical protein
MTVTVSDRASIEKSASTVSHEGERSTRLHKQFEKIALWDQFEFLEVIDPNAILKELSVSRSDPGGFIDDQPEC